MTIRSVSLSLIAALALAAPAQAYVLQPQQVGPVTYVSGGIGDEERNALKSVSNQYNLSIVSAAKSGAYVGNTAVTIYDQQGRPMVSTDSGPLFYAKLPPGRYTVEGSSQGQTRRQAITVAEGRPAHIHFSWNTPNVN